MLKNIKIHAEWIKEFGLYQFLKKTFAMLTRNESKLDEVYENILVPYAIDALKMLHEEEKTCERGMNTIWTFWWSGEESMPPLAKAGLNSIRAYSNTYNVVLLEQKNIETYVHMPQLYYDLLNAKKISVIHFCDLLRIRVLRDQGGIWLDSTLFLGKEIPNNIMDYKIFSAKRVPDGFKNISNGRWAGNFLCTNEKNNRLMRALVLLYDKYFIQHKMVITYFMLDYCMDLLVKYDPVIARMVEDIPFNNPDIKKLNNMLFDAYDKEIWSKMLSNTYAFKLNWRSYDVEKSKIEGTYYKNIILK